MRPARTLARVRPAKVSTTPKPEREIDPVTDWLGEPHLLDDLKPVEANRIFRAACSYRDDALPAAAVGEYSALRETVMLVRRARRIAGQLGRQADELAARAGRLRALVAAR
jgi:hypothetical protein